MKCEIGSDFFEINLNNCVKNDFWWDNAAYQCEYLMSGRNALLGLCRILQDSGKRVLLPAYTCATVIVPFLQEGWEVFYYDINRDLSINAESVKNMIAELLPDVFLLHSYFGFDFVRDIRELVRFAKEHLMLVVEDLTQCLFSEHRIPDADYYISSLRKFLAVPDGGILVSKKTIPLMPDTASDELSEISHKAYSLKKKYFETQIPAIKDEFRALFAQCNAILASNGGLRKASDQTRQIYRKTDFDALKKTRMRNYNLLHSLLSASKLIQPILASAADGTTPLYLPVYVFGEQRAALQKFLATKHIYCPVIWPRPSEIPSVSAEVAYIYEHILCIPIDQRYGNEEMQYIASEIYDFEERTMSS